MDNSWPFPTGADGPGSPVPKRVRRRGGRRPGAQVSQEHLRSLPEVAKLWLLKLLFELGAHRQCFRESSVRVTALIDVFSLRDLDLTGDDADADVAQIARRLKTMYSVASQQAVSLPADCNLSRNIARLAGLVGLMQTDCRILEFAILLKSEPVLDETADLLGGLSSRTVSQCLSALLNIPVEEIHDRLSQQSLLAQTGLLTVDRNGNGTLSYKLDLLSPTFADNVLTQDADPVYLLRNMVVPSLPPQLGLADYTHIGDHLKVVRPYLRHARETGRPGVNVLVYGPPGTGKSELVKVLAEDLGCELFEIASENGDGDPVGAEQRLRAFRAAQSFFSRRRALLLFDEVEDVFDDSSSLFRRKNGGRGHKAWINRALEGNRVPALWVSNSASCMDDAFVRRFDMVIELPVPPKKQRSKIINQVAGDLLDAATIGRFAESETLAPAVLTRAAGVVHAVRDQLEASEVSPALEHLVNSTLAAQSHERIQAPGRWVLPGIYDPVFIQADKDLALVAEGIAEARAARVCLYGAPGTGKTAFGHFLAQRLEVPLLVRKASDILSKWVGEAEQNIAAAFRQAKDEGAILMIDEIDGLLQDRRHAARSWEITQVNEMLTQMEAFDGVFIASTNLVSGLDQASLRRFDLKVRFDCLSSDKAWDLLGRQVRALGLAEPPEAIRPKLDRLRTLTPGDFAAVARRHRFHPVDSAVAFVGALEDECALKEDQGQTIGFV